MARSAAGLLELERLAGYKLTEIAWLLSLAHEAALEHDDNLSSSAGLILGGSGASDASEGRLLTVLRWQDVHSAARRATDARDRRIATLRAEGYTEREVADLVDTSQPTVSRRYRATLRGGAARAGVAESVPARCEDARAVVGAVTARRAAFERRDGV